MRSFTYGILLSFFFVGCSSPKSLEFKGLQSLEIKKMSLGNNEFIAKFQYINPNHFTLKLQSLDCDIKINDQPFTHYHLDSAFIIPSNTQFILPAKLNIQLTEILKHSVDLVFNKPMKITINGNAILSKGFLTKQIPINYTTTQKLNLDIKMIKEALKQSNL